MATFYIQRREAPLLTPRLLVYKSQAFRTLYCGFGQADPQLIIEVRGRWPSAYNGDGLFLEYQGGVVTNIGSKYVTLKYRDSSTGEHETIKVELCPTPDTGFTEIMFMTSR